MHDVIVGYTRKGLYPINLVRSTGNDELDLIVTKYQIPITDVPTQSRHINNLRKAIIMDYISKPDNSLQCTCVYILW